MTELWREKAVQKTISVQLSAASRLFSENVSLCGSKNSLLATFRSVDEDNFVVSESLASQRCCKGQGVVAHTLWY